MSDARRMTGEEMGALTNALCAAFDLASFEIMLRTRLNRRLDTVAGEGPMRVVAFKTIDVASREGWGRQLISAACAANPGNPELRQFRQQHPDLVDPPPTPLSPPPPLPPQVPDPQPAVPWYRRWFKPRRFVIAVASVLFIIGAIWALGWFGDRRGSQRDRDQKAESPDPSGTARGARPTGPLRLDDGKDRTLAVNALRGLEAGGATGSRTIHVALWVWGPPTHQDLDVLETLARELRAGGARVGTVGAEEGRLEKLMRESGLKAIQTADVDKLLSSKAIDVVVFIGQFRRPLKMRDSKDDQGQMEPVVAVCKAGKDCFIVLSTEDKVRWERYLGKHARAASRRGIDEIRKAGRLLYASVPVPDGYKEDFSSFFKAIRDRNPKLRGSVELLP